MIVKKRVDGFNWTLDTSDGGIGIVLAGSDTDGKNANFARERLFMLTLDSVVTSGMTCIDVGANIGYATMFMARNCGNPENVYAIEPDAHNASFLKLNLISNGFENCNTSDLLISDTNGERDFWIARHPNLNSVSKTKHSIRKERVRSVTLETFCKDQNIYPNFIKMDIEGHEVDVFNGAYNFFKENEGETHFLLEVHPKMYNSENDFAKTLKRYEGIGFRVKLLIATPVSNPAPFKKLGYKPVLQVPSDGWIRSIYVDVDNDEAIRICTSLHADVPGGKSVRAILVSREGQ